MENNFKQFIFRFPFAFSIFEDESHTAFIFKCLRHRYLRFDL
jgi:hypothetical protein